MADQGSRGPRVLKVSSSIMCHVSRVMMSRVMSNVSRVMSNICHDVTCHVSGDRGLLSSVSGDLPTAILEGPPGPPGEKGNKMIIITPNIY